MEDFEESIARAADSVAGLAEGPGQAAARALEEAFGRAGQSIETALGQAARAGELDFSRMAQSVLGDLARIGAEAAIARAGLGTAAQGLTVNMNVAGDAASGGAGAARGEIARAVARAVAVGGRFR